MASPVVSQGQSRMTGQPSQLTWRWLTSDTSRDITKRYKQEKAAIDHAGWAMQSSKCRGINKGRLLVFSSRAAGWGPRASLTRPIKCRKCRASRGSGSATGPRQGSTWKRYIKVTRTMRRRGTMGGSRLPRNCAAHCYNSITWISISLAMNAQPAWQASVRKYCGTVTILRK
jgi:hypothetical protein